MAKSKLWCYIICHCKEIKQSSQVGERLLRQLEKVDTLKYALLHWDFKLMGTLLNKNVNEEQPTVSVNKVNEVKLLGLSANQPCANRRSKDNIKEKRIKLFKRWNCRQSIVSSIV